MGDLVNFKPLYFDRVAVCVWSAVFTVWFCPARPSGLRATPCARAASIIAAQFVAFAANLTTRLSASSAAASVTG